ncbi:MAG: ABC transporter ATP-binding protein [Termitinemataceae bacterium]|nr:MAG: ABC transporter ATP-binding protein [Termitinemataceae bacterium]
MPENIISLNGVQKIYTMGADTVHALRGVSFSIAQGEYVSIMGPSGSGKSTCMNMIGCLDTPSSGEIFINGKNTALLNETELAALRNKTVGFVFQQYHLLSSMTVLENVMLPLRYKGIEQRKRKTIACDMLKNVSLDDRMNHRPSELSGGQKQRAAIARAAVTNPKIILADEPTGALDSETGTLVLNLFKEINKKGTTVIIVTHDSKVGSAANRLINIFDGKIVSDVENHV